MAQVHRFLELMSRVHRRDWACLSLVTASFLLLWYFYFTGLYCSDDTRYLIGAIKIAVGDPISTTSLAERRVMFLLPAALAYAPGRNLEWLIVPYGLFYVGVGITGYVLARQVMPRWASTIATLLAASQSALFLYAGAMLPDLPATLFMTLALLMLCGWFGAIGSGSFRKHGWLAFGIGASVAAAFTAKESALVFLPIPLVLMALSSRRRRFAERLGDAVALLLGIAVVMAFEACIFRLTAGHWHSSVLNLFQPHNFDSFLQHQGTSPLARLKTLRRELGPQTTTLFVLALVSTLHLAYQWRKQRLSSVQAWIWLAVIVSWLWPLLYFSYGTASMSRYMLPVMQQRYYAPCIVPAAILAVHLVSWGFRPVAAMSGRMARAILAGMLLLFLLSAPFAERRQRGLIYEASAKEAFELAQGEAARLYPGVPLYDVDSGWTTDLNRCRALLMPILPDGRQRLLESLRSGDNLHGQFGYPEIEDLQPPFLLVGNGPFLSTTSPTSWVQSLRREINEGRLRAQKVGRYGIMPRRSLRGLTWMPRTMAVGVAYGDGRPLRAAAESRSDPHVHPRYVELYLLVPGSHR